MIWIAAVGIYFIKVSMCWYILMLSLYFVCFVISNSLLVVKMVSINYFCKLLLRNNVFCKLGVHIICDKNWFGYDDWFYFY